MGNILKLNQFKSIPPFTERRRTRKREITVQELIQGLPVFAYRNLTDDIEVTIIQADQELPVMVDVIQVGRALSTFIEKARESSVPIHRDDKLADTLSRLDIGEMIPPELYEVVAEILVFVDAVDHRMVKENVADGGKHKN